MVFHGIPWRFFIRVYTKIQKLEEEIATLYHKRLISKKLETAEMSLTGVLDAIFETEEEGEEE